MVLWDGDTAGSRGGARAGDGSRAEDGVGHKVRHRARDGVWHRAQHRARDEAENGAQHEVWQPKLEMECGPAVRH